MPFTEAASPPPCDEQVNKDGQIQPTLHVVQVMSPTHTSGWGTHDKLARQVIRHHCMVVPRIGRAFEFLRVASPQPGAACACPPYGAAPSPFAATHAQCWERPPWLLSCLNWRSMALIGGRRFVSVTPCVVATATDLAKAVHNARKL